MAGSGVSSLGIVYDWIWVNDRTTSCDFNGKGGWVGVPILPKDFNSSWWILQDSSSLPRFYDYL